MFMLVFRECMQKIVGGGGFGGAILYVIQVEKVGSSCRFGILYMVFWQDNNLPSPKP